MVVFLLKASLESKQLKSLKKLLNSNDVRKAKYRVVYLHHHPLDFRALLYLKDADELRSTLRGHKIDAMLFGHYHDAIDLEW